MNASNELTGPNYNMVQSVEFEKLENARLLNTNEFTYNAVLGYISLNQSLNNDEVLAVAYQYTYNGKTYQVGELSTDGIAGQEALYLKLLKSTVRNPRIKLWDLMMKNVYSLGAYQVDPLNFRLDIWYNNPSSSIDINYIPKTGVDKKLLIQLLDLDRLNQQMATYADGLFDFVPVTSNQGKIPNGGTINPRNGRLYFTTIEPFGKTLDDKLSNEGISAPIRKTVVFQELYDSTKTAAQQLPELNRFKIKGTYQSSASSEISLNSMNIPQGSVVVTAGGQILTEGTQYRVDYNLGRVKILDEGILSSGTPIKISLESNSLFSVQLKSLMGTHLDYKISKNANVGATIMRLTEKPLTQKVNIGEIQNRGLGMDVDIFDDMGLSIKNSKGELVCKKPFPSMPLKFWNDLGNKKYKSAYFEKYKNIWHHGDFAKVTKNGGFIIYGRSDTTLNPGGVRLGTAEIESSLVLHSDVAEAAVVGYPHDIKGQGIYAYVTLMTGIEPAEALRKDLIAFVAKDIGAFAKPEIIQFAPGLPKTRSGKIMRRILRKIAADELDNLGDTTTLADPTVVEQLIENRVNK